MGRGHLDEKNVIHESQVLSKSCSYNALQCNGVNCTEQFYSCQDKLLTSQTSTPDFMDRGHLDGKKYIFEGQVLSEVKNAPDRMVKRSQNQRIK